MIDLDSPEQFMQKRMRSVDRRRLLQPRTSSQIVEFTARVYQKLAWPIMKLTFTSTCLFFIALMFFQAFILPGIFQTRAPDDITQQFEEVLFIVGIGLFVGLPIALFSMAHSIGVATRAVAEYVLEQKIDTTRALEAANRGVKTMLSLLFHVFLRSGIYLVAAGTLFMVSAYFENIGNQGLAEIMTVVAVLGLIVTVIITPIFFGSVSLAPAVAAIEEVNPKQALKRGGTLIKRTRHIASGYDALVHVWLVAFFSAVLLWSGTYGVLELTTLLDMLRDLSGRSVVWSIVAESIAALPGLVTVWLLIPYLSCGLTVIYFDRRVKLEALDIETMAHDVIKGTEQADLRM